MIISDDGIKVTKRFFEAIDYLKKRKTIRGLGTFTRNHGVNKWNLITVRKQPECSVLKPELLTWLVIDYGISAEWLLTGKGEILSETCSKFVPTEIQ